MQRSYSIIILQKLSPFFLLGVSILPAVLLCFMLVQYWVNIPVWDEWDGFENIFEKYYTKTLTFNDFITQHNESRTMFPRLIVLGLGLMTGWDVRVVMCVSIAMACGISLNLFVLLSRVNILPLTTKLVLLSLSNLFVFSFVQWENWLWGLQMVVYLPPLMLTTGLIINTSKMPLWKKVICNSVLSFISTLDIFPK